MAEAFDELTTFIDLVNGTFDKHADARATCMAALGKTVRPTNEHVEALATELKQVAADEGLELDNGAGGDEGVKAEETDDSADDGNGDRLPEPPADPAGADAIAKSSETEDEEATTQEWGLAPASSSQEPSVPAPCEEAKEPPTKKTRMEEQVQTAKLVTLELALINQGVPMGVREIITKMKDCPAELDWNSSLVRKVERAIIFRLGLGMKFAQRGPPSPESGGPSRWGGKSGAKSLADGGTAGAQTKSSTSGSTAARAAAKRAARAARRAARAASERARDRTAAPRRYRQTKSTIRHTNN